MLPILRNTAGSSPLIEMEWSAYKRHRPRLADIADGNQRSSDMFNADKVASAREREGRS